MSTAINPPDGDRNGPSTRTDQPVVRDDRAGAAAGAGYDRSPRDHHEVVARQKEQFGGMKFGACFFGWLAATGMAVLLTALAAGIGTGLGISRNVNSSDATAGNIQTAGIVGAVALLVIVLIAYYCGGYVAGRMARFNGVKQGVGVWLWAIIVAIVLAIIGAVAGSKFNVLGQLSSLPSIPVSGQTATTAGIVTAVAVAIVSLVGAILGGLAGMRFHRKVDRVGLN